MNLATEGKVYLESILKTMDIKTRMEVRTMNDGSEIYYHVESDENALLIGREGRTLLALQFMLRNYLNLFVDEHIVVSLDIGNYHENRRKQLEILATKTAKKLHKLKLQSN